MQLRSRLSATLVGLAVAGGAISAAVLGPAGPAVGQSSPSIQAQIQVNSPATLVAKGAGVDVPVTITCTGQLSAFVVVGLTESVGGKTALGTSAANFDCTGASQNIEVLVIAESSGPSGIPTGASKAFKDGSAIANAQINVCTADGSTCAEQQVEPTIQISK